MSCPLMGVVCSSSTLTTVTTPGCMLQRTNGASLHSQEYMQGDISADVMNMAS